MWGIKKTTHGMVSLAAIYVRHLTGFIMAVPLPYPQAVYLVSPDTQLSKIGDKSKINYAQNFRSYKNLIAQKAHTPAMKTTMAFFDKELFVGIRGSADNGGTVNEDLSDQLVIAMADFGLGKEDDGDDDGTAGADEEVPQHPPPARCRTALRVISETEPTPEAVHSQPSQRNATPGPSR